ncbi:HAMP domain-containing histidine kinase [Streptomyces sp. GMY02]|uniref:sensor histidine kinase n=1 Tax=Streptomyces sp. GMY02 TaxID=1333528 RepID=UPI001C2B8DAF|nr:HAMP domain-containing sensor histidine kinase [Streptomyces sp. GMY02]QXE38278.1 HAMP domain-containing histidine kinase [Streptomyces sp. GMY02]
MRRRILGSTVLAVVCAVLLFALPLAVAALRLYEQDEERELRQLGERVAVGLPVPLGRPGAGDPVELPRAEAGTRIAVYGPDGLRVAGTGPRAGDGPVRAAAAGRAATARSGEGLVAAVPVGGAEHVRAVVRVTSPAADPYRRAALTWAGMAVPAALAVGVGVLLAVRSSRRLARPLEALAVAARDMERGEPPPGRAPATGLPEADAVADALARAADRIGLLLRRERAFSADASHQLRTALTGVRLELETPLAPAARADPYTALRSALQQVERMETTLTDLLALARDVPERAPLDPVPLLDGIERHWHGELAAGGRRLRVMIDEDLPDAVGSPRAARQVLDVLIANARTHGGGTVTVRVRESAGVLAVDVEDEGAGIPEDTDPFVRRGHATEDGHGIGLALARSLAEAEGGRLFVSRPRPHPRFTWLVALPARPAPTTLPSHGPP